jgi:hypothetical protein
MRFQRFDDLINDRLIRLDFMLVADEDARPLC